MRTRRTPRFRVSSRGRQRGAVLIEFVVIVPVLLTLAFGTAEFGMAWRESAALTRTTGQAARTLSSIGSNSYADKEMLLAFSTSLGSSPRVSMQADDFVIVYNAKSSPDGRVPAGCLSGGIPQSVPNLCTVYTKSDIDSQLAGYTSADLLDSDCQSAASAGEGWDPCSRNWFTSNQNPDAAAQTEVGVYAQVTYSPITGSFLGMKLTRESVYQIEPCMVSTPNAGARGPCPI